MAINKNIISQTTGDNSDAVQVFINNYFTDIDYNSNLPFEFYVPTYSLQGATLNFYQQTTDSISTNLNNLKDFTFNFTGNTSSLSGTTLMQHKIYKLKYDDYQNALTGVTVINLSTATTITNSGTTSATTTIIKTGYTQSYLNAIEDLTTPYTIYLEAVSGSSFNYINSGLTTHVLALPQSVKPVGKFTENLFEDKAQYFIDSNFIFSAPIDTTLGEVQTLSAYTNNKGLTGLSATTLYIMPSGDTTTWQTNGITNIITGGTFSNVDVNGSYFCYFSIPQKPDIYILNGGTQTSVPYFLNTYSPIFSFNNVSDGDYQKLEIDYDVTDVNFTGQTTVFNIPAQQGDPNFIRSFGTPLSPNKSFLWRIGNVKEIINIFGIKQNVTNYSNYSSGTTLGNGQISCSGTTFVSNTAHTLSSVTLTLTVYSTFSQVEIGSDSTNDPSVTSQTSNAVGGGSGTTLPTVISDVNGNFNFGYIDGGQYILSAIPPHSTGLLPLTQIVNITPANPNLEIIFDLNWGMTKILFSDNYNFG